MTETLPELEQGSTAPETPRRSAALGWAGMVFVAALGLSVVAPQFPASWKRLGLMYAGLGALTGGIAAWLAVRARSGDGTGLGSEPGGSEEAQLPRPRRLLWGVLLMTLAGFVNTAFLSSRQYRQAVAASFGKDPNAAAFRELLKKGAATDPEAAAQLETLNQRLTPGFRDYLAFRFSQLSRRPSPVPELLWGVELALGLLTAGVAYRTVCKRLAG